MTNQRRTFSQEFKQEAVALVVEHGYSYKPPRYTRQLVINLHHIPSLPNLISQFLSKGFDVDFGEHGLRMACL